MKELILISLVALFIACQNQPLPESKNESPKEAVIATQASLPAQALESFLCDNQTLETFDVIKELENADSPGIQYRKPVLQSEIAASQASQSELVCVSQVTSSSEEDGTPAEVPETTTVSLKNEEAPAAAEEASWLVLTEKWEVVKEKVSCLDPQANSLNPACEEASFMAEDGKLFSDQFEDSYAAL